MDDAVAMIASVVCKLPCLHTSSIHSSIPTSKDIRVHMPEPVPKSEPSFPHIRYHLHQYLD